MARYIGTITRKITKSMVVGLHAILADHIAHVRFSVRGAHFSLVLAKFYTLI
jgi:hypothetical protein